MRIAVIGTGIAGNGAAWLLSQAHEVTVYEKNAYAGGHSNTVVTPAGTPVDTGFIVYNERTYPNFIALLDHLGVVREKTDMSFSVSLDDGRLEYAGDTPGGLFLQKKNLLSPRFHRMWLDILRFYRAAPSVLEGKAWLGRTLGEYLTQNRYSDAFTDDHLLPMGAAIWSMTSEEMKGFPVTSFVRFCDNHGLLLLANRPQWWTIKGGSREYVAKLTESFSGRIRLSLPARLVRRRVGAVEVTDAAGHTEQFDQVVFACHADEALSLLSDADDIEKDILGAFAYSANTAWLHQDETLMPRRRRAWCSWNYLSSRQEGTADGLYLSYWMNRLQHIDGGEPLFVTLNPPRPPREGTDIQKILYHHPQFTTAALRAQARLPEIQGKIRSWFCGSYCGYGFHEDGLASGLAVAEALGGVRRPWTVREKSPAAFCVTGGQPE